VGFCLSQLFFEVGILNGFDRQYRILKIAVVNTTVTGADGRMLCEDEALALKAIYIFLDGVVAHAESVADGRVARMAFESFPVLAEHEEGIDGDLACIKSEAEYSLWQRKEIAGIIPTVWVITVIVFQ